MVIVEKLSLVFWTFLFIIIENLTFPTRTLDNDFIFRLWLKADCALYNKNLTILNPLNKIWTHLTRNFSLQCTNPNWLIFHLQIICHPILRFGSFVHNQTLEFSLSSLTDWHVNRWNAIKCLKKFITCRTWNSRFIPEERSRLWSFYWNDKSKWKLKISIERKTWT